MWTAREQLLGCEKVGENVSSQELEMQTCGKKWEGLHELVKKRHLGGSGTS